MSEMCACETQDKHVRKENECVVTKVTIDSFKAKVKLLDFMNFQSMQFDLQILGDASKINQAITQIKAVPVDGKGGDSGKETIHIPCSHNSPILKIL